MSFRARKKHAEVAHKMCFKESAHSRETLEEVKNHYIRRKMLGGTFLRK